MFGCKVCAVCNRPSCRAGAQHIGCAQRTCSEKIETVQDVLLRSLPCKHKYNTFKYEKQKQQKSHKPRLSSRISSVVVPCPTVLARIHSELPPCSNTVRIYLIVEEKEREKKETTISFNIIKVCAPLLSCYHSSFCIINELLTACPPTWIECLLLMVRSMVVL